MFNFPKQSEILTQQQAATVICIVFRPGWQTCFKFNGRWEFLFSPRSMASGLALAETWTLAGQFVFIERSSWWKHFNCSSTSLLTINVLYISDFIWNMWLLTARLCSNRNGDSIVPSRTGNVNLNSSSSAIKINKFVSFFV